MCCAAARAAASAVPCGERLHQTPCAPPAPSACACRVGKRLGAGSAGFAPAACSRSGPAARCGSTWYRMIVKTGVKLHHAIDVSLLHGSFRSRPSSRSICFDLLVRRPFSRQRGRQRFKRAANFKDVGHVFERDVGDIGAPTRDHHHEPCQLQLADGFPHRRAAHAQVFGQLRLHQALPGRKRPVEDRLPDRCQTPALAGACTNVTGWVEVAAILLPSSPTSGGRLKLPLPDARAKAPPDPKALPLTTARRRSRRPWPDQAHRRHRRAASRDQRPRSPPGRVISSRSGCDPGAKPACGLLQVIIETACHLRYPLKVRGRERSTVARIRSSKSLSDSPGAASQAAARRTPCTRHPSAARRQDEPAPTRAPGRRDGTHLSPLGPCTASCRPDQRHAGYIRAQRRRLFRASASQADAEAEPPVQRPAKTAAASALPPPRPAATGIRFSDPHRDAGTCRNRPRPSSERQQARHRFPDQVSVSSGTPGTSALIPGSCRSRSSGSLLDRNFQPVVQSEPLDHRGDRMVPVVPPSPPTYSAKLTFARPVSIHRKARHGYFPRTIPSFPAT